MIDGPLPPLNDTIAFFSFFSGCVLGSCFLFYTYPVASPFFSSVLFIHGALRIVSRLLLLLSRRLHQYFISLLFFFNFGLGREKHTQRHEIECKSTGNLKRKRNSMHFQAQNKKMEGDTHGRDFSGCIYRTPPSAGVSL